MAQQSLRMYAEPLREVGFAAIGAVYTGIGTGLAYPARIIYIQNLTRVLLYFSLDGISDHLPLAPNATTVIDVTANKSKAEQLCFSEGTRFYVRAPGVLPLIGSAYITSFYAVEI